MYDDRLTPAEFRHKALILMRQCWKPVLFILLLTNVLGVVAQVIMQPVPAAADEAATLTGQITGGEIPMGCLIAGIALQLVEALVLQPVLMQGLIRKLLNHLRGETCGLHGIVRAFSRWKTAVALEFQICLRILGYQVLGLIGMFLLSFIPILGALGAAIGYIMLLYWAALRYFDAQIHLADDKEHQLNSTDCIAYSLHDAEIYSVSGLFKTLWPAFVPAILGNLLTRLLPASLLAYGADLALGMIAAALQTAICTVIYVGLQSGKLTNQDNTPESEGLARARALAAGTDEGGTAP